MNALAAAVIAFALIYVAGNAYIAHDHQASYERSAARIAAQHAAQAKEDLSRCLEGRSNAIMIQGQLCKR